VFYGVLSSAMYYIGQLKCPPIDSFDERRSVSGVLPIISGGQRFPAFRGFDSNLRLFRRCVRHSLKRTLVSRTAGIADPGAIEPESTSIQRLA
jgi:hypothetical protein